LEAGDKISLYRITIRLIFVFLVMAIDKQCDDGDDDVEKEEERDDEQFDDDDDC
jgi:hypothetical protein